MLSHLDLAIIGLYVLAMTLFGLWFSRQQKDLKTYFVGDRNVGWFLVLMSIVATETSAVTFLSVPGTAFSKDMTFLQLSFGYIVGRCIVAWLLLPLYMKGELFSAYQVLREKFGPGTQRVASALFLITRTIADGLRLYLTALVVQYIGWTIPQAILATGVVTILYTYLGGMKAVLWTDVIQFVIKIAGAALAFVCVIQILPGGWDQLVSLGDAAGKFHTINLSFSLTADDNLWVGLIGGAAFTMASHGADQLMVQRYLCARNLGEARLALILSGITVCVQFAFFLILGVGFYAAVQAGQFDLTLSNGRTAMPDEVFGHFIVTKMSPGIVGILVAAILAAAMSTLSSSLNSSANAFVTDFYRPLRPGTSEAHAVKVSRVMTAVWGVLQMGVAFIAFTDGSDRAVVKRVLGVAGMTTGLVLGLFILGRFRTVVSGRSAMIGLVSGFIVVVGLWLPGQIPGTRTILAWPWFPLIGATTTVLMARVVDRLTPSLIGSPHGPAATSGDGSPQPGLPPAR